MPAFKNQRTKRIVFAVSVLFIISLFVPAPYYLYQPGSVEELSSKVSVEDGKKTEKGQLHLTTVLSIKASNIYYLAYALLDPHTTLERTTRIRGNMTDTEYSRWLEHLMKASQQQAIIAGLRAGGEDFNIRPDGVLVRSVSDKSKAKGLIEVGDIIRKVDEEIITQSSDLLSYLEQKKADETVTVVYERGGKEYTDHIKLIPLSGTKVQAGIGVVLEDKIMIESSRDVKIQAGEIGGPSAGLMFSLEIYNQLQEDDITKGYEIAGTGTIDHEGNVGQIGGIREKITAVEKAGMDIFFCPKDVKPTDSNEKDVVEEAEKFGYSVKIVPVQTLQEAIGYLEKLPPK